MSASSAALRGRRKAESLMVDECLVERDTGQTVTDPVTGKVAKVMSAVYSGRCKVQWGNSQESNPVAAGHVYTAEPGRIDLPVSAHTQTGDQVTVTKALDVVTGLPDPDRLGKRARLISMDRGTYRTADRWNVELITG